MQIRWQKGAGTKMQEIFSWEIKYKTVVEFFLRVFYS